MLLREIQISTELPKHWFPVSKTLYLLYHPSPTHRLYIFHSALSSPFIVSLQLHSICHRTKMADAKT